METSPIKSLVLGMAAFWLSATALWAQASADVAANPGVPAASLDKTALKDIMLGKTAYWEGGQAITIVVLTDKTDAAIQDVTGMSASAFKTFWQRLTFSGRGKQPKEVNSVEKL